MAMRIGSTLPTHLTGGSFLRYEVGDNVRMQMPDAFWGRLQREYGRIRYVQSRGEAAAVVTSCELIITCLRDTEVPHTHTLTLTLTLTLSLSLPLSLPLSLSLSLSLSLTLTLTLY